MKRITSVIPAVACLFVLAVAADSALGALYTESFDTDQTANWTINASPVTDSFATVFFDYGSIGIPSAPNSSGGTTRGLKLQANLFSGVFGGISASPTGQSFSGNYSVKWDQFSSMTGPLTTGGCCSTNLSYGGVGSSGTFNNAPGFADGVYFAHTLDGGSAADYRAYSPERVVSYQLPPAVPADNHATYLAGSRNNTASYYRTNINPPPDPNNPTVGSTTAPPDMLTIFPQLTGAVQSGVPSMTWRRHEIRVVNDIYTWYIDGVPLIIVDGTSFDDPNGGVPLGGGNIFFGHSDTNNGSSTDPNSFDLLFTLIDNIEVTEFVPPDDANFNNDDFVDGIDFLMWQQGFGTLDAQHGDGDANFDGFVDADDLAIWEIQYGTPGPLAGVTAVPEPTSWAALAVAVCLCLTLVRSRPRLALAARRVS